MLTTITAIAGLIFGLSALLLSLLNYRRDRPKLLVALRWDAIIVRDSKGCDATFGQVYLTNTGRRPIYITAAGVEFDPPNAAWFTLTKKQGKIRGRKLAEGDPPLSFVVDAVGRGADMTRANSRYWREFRAFAEDSTGKRYYSKKTTICPSWGEGDGRVPSNYLASGRIIECNLDQHELESYLIKGEWVLVSAADISHMREQLKDAGLDPAAYFSFEKDPETITVIGWTGRPNSLGPG